MAASSRRSPREAWDFMLPGPASRGNGGCCDCSSSGLLAYGAGSSVAIVDIRSTQLVSVLPMPTPSSSSLSLSPFVTSLRWAPHPLRPDPSVDPSISHLRLAIGDRHGRIALCDLRSRQILLWFDSDPKPASSSAPGIQDLCWILSGHSFFLLASIGGPSLLSLWNPSTGRCVWKYDASPEYLSCIRRDPFDSRHLCALGLRGFLLSARVLGDRGEVDVAIREHQIPAAPNDSFHELRKLEKEAAANAATPNAPALAVFPTFFVRFGFSPQWRHILFVIFPRVLVVFDLEFGPAFYSMGFRRGCAIVMEVGPVFYNDLIYCAHLDGKLSIWKRKE